MAYLSVTPVGDSILVDFGVYAGAQVPTGYVPIKRVFPKTELVLTLVPDSAYIEAQTVYNGLTFPVTFNGASGSFKVDSVNGVAPASNADLFDKLLALL